MSLILVEKGSIAVGLPFLEVCTVVSIGIWLLGVFPRVLCRVDLVCLDVMTCSAIIG